MAAAGHTVVCGGVVLDQVRLRLPCEFFSVLSITLLLGFFGGSHLGFCACAPRGRGCGGLGVVITVVWCSDWLRVRRRSSSCWYFASIDCTRARRSAVVIAAHSLMRPLRTGLSAGGSAFMTAEIREASFARWVGVVASLRRAYSSLRAVAWSNSWIGTRIVWVILKGGGDVSYS